MAYRTYNGDPYWITLKYPGTCAGCGRPLHRGDEAFRYKTGHLYGADCGCGRTHEADFIAAAEDEDQYNGYTY